MTKEQFAHHLSESYIDYDITPSDIQMAQESELLVYFAINRKHYLRGIINQNPIEPFTICYKKNGLGVVSTDVYQLAKWLPNNFNLPDVQLTDLLKGIPSHLVYYLLPYARFTLKNQQERVHSKGVIFHKSDIDNLLKPA